MLFKRPPLSAPSFSGHESFPLRYAWLKKGYDALEEEDNQVFSSESGMVELGVGKNMVRAIRHWGLVAGMWEVIPQSRGKDLRPTLLGHSLLMNVKGWDPYMDELGTIWLLHWQLTKAPEGATAWWYLFSRPRSDAFTKAELEAELQEVADEAEGGRRVPSSTIQRDIDVLVRCYTRAKAERGAWEEVLNSPLMALDLVRPVPGRKGAYVCPLGAQPTLPQGIFDAALVDFCGRTLKDGVRSFSFDKLLYDWGSPGRIFRLTESALMERLHHTVTGWPEHFSFGETANLRQLMLRGETLPRFVEDMLTRHYADANTEEAA